MTNALSVLSTQPRAALAATAAAAAAGGLLAHKWNAAVQNKRLEKGFLRASRRHRVGDDTDSDEKPALVAKVDAQFFANLTAFVKICIPGVASTEFLALSTVAALLGARSYLDLWASSNGGHVVKAIVGRDKDAFIQKAIIDIATMMFPMSFVNNSLKYMISRLKVLMRRRLSMHFHDKYLSSNTFYKVSNLDSRIRNIDQLLTVDIEKFCSSMADLYSNISKPSFDIILFSRQLSRSLGPSGPICMILYFGFCSIILRAVQPPFGQLAADEQRLEGEYRLHHSRLIAHSEEIAFFGGGGREKQYINLAFDNVVDHLKKLFAARWRNGFVDAILVKYLATVVGYSIVSIPVFFTDSMVFQVLNHPRRFLAGNTRSKKKTDPETTSASNIAGLYTRNSRLLLQLASAIGRLVLAGKEITKLTGYCQRVTRLQHVLDDLGDERAVQKRFESSPDLERDLKLAELMIPGELIVGSEDEGPEKNVVRFSGVNLLSPDCTILAENLTFEIPRGCHVLTTGPNGSGKSSLFRVLAGLWPLYGGTLHRPSRSRIFYVPQRPYLALGTLRENVTYPMTWTEAVQQKGATDDLIIELLEMVHLGDITRRKGGLDAVQDWAEVLSGGQKQRLGFSRLLFHKPDYAILDEASSAVSIDVEQLLYQSVKDCGITLISVSHRPSLWSFHDKVLAFDGEGSYEFREIKAGDVPSLVSGVPGSSGT
ncbi:ATP-binding cassette, sub-family D (ALD), member 3 [Chondrus crispus]|uniref:ATP-binding cassette, sub-family D (ALD), member 3 n=1 Tax=Chondrus crispus TaxID=2769 RepID=R7QFQ6_CHOCR|nr:ATP-binding cassette, sub-family D (ALD), member 3 [Chondrus crispus]CDF36904.1 ATP-binding cassette, sub-family D (ALD), member 3 [Chondrus crispus]|eukprot:XP_005716723.1 ATP-binding cassette, sub-family D (ALD), member 3 [Chondrus crispus]